MGFLSAFSTKQKVVGGVIVVLVLMLTTFAGQWAMRQSSELQKYQEVLKERNEYATANQAMAQQLSSLVIEKNASERAYTRKIAKLLDGQVVYDEESGSEKESAELSKQLTDLRQSNDVLTTALNEKDADINALQTKIAGPGHKLYRVGVTWDQVVENVLATSGGRLYLGGGINCLLGSMQLTPMVKLGSAVDQPFRLGACRVALSADLDF